jgi:hypothetical protein
MVQRAAAKVRQECDSTQRRDSASVTVKMTKPYRKVPAKTSVQYPYRAVICGEEHIVQGWRSGNLLTDKDEFVFRRLYGKQVESEWTGAIPGGVPSDYPIQSTTLLEVATLQSDGNGGWLLNGHNFGSLQFLPAGCRLNGITSSEVLRVHKGEIHAVAWVQAISTGSITLQLDAVLADWKAARQLDKANPTFAMPDSLSVNLFCGWSKPIWLTEFHQVGAETNPWLDGLSKLLESPPEPVPVAEMLEKGINPYLAGVENVPAQPAIPKRARLKKARQPKRIVRATNVVEPVKSAPRYFTIKTAAGYAKKSERTIRNWIKNDWLIVEKNKSGRKIRIEKTALDKSINKQ